MARMIDIEEQHSRLRISFPYDRELVAVVRTLPDRWYDKHTRSWLVPLEHLAFVISKLEAHHFKHSEDLRSYCADNQSQARELPAPALPTVPEGTLTVAQLNHQARLALRERFAEAVWLVGELQDFDKNRASGYRTFFFDLVERPYAGASEVARIKAVLFEDDRRRVEEALRQSALDVRLRDGLAVRVLVKIDLYPQNGRFQVIVQDVDPRYTAGELEMNRERAFRALEARGVAGLNLALPLPLCPLRVGLITSYESDAYNDFAHQLAQSGFGFALTVHHANVQGVHTEASVLRALRYFEARASDFDVVAIVRGGGSRSDLAYFDTEAIGEAVCRLPLKVICGVGHQRDVCLLDVISTSTKTPTAAADVLIEQVERFGATMEDRYARLARHATRQVERERQRLRVASAVLERDVTRGVERARLREARARDRVSAAVRRRVDKAARHTERAEERLARAVERRTDDARREVERASRGLSWHAVQARLRRRLDEIRDRQERLDRATRVTLMQARAKLEFAEEQRRLLDPARVLSRGFAIVRGPQGVVRGPGELEVGAHFEVELAGGRLTATRISDPDDVSTRVSSSPQSELPCGTPPEESP
ncbi:exodeoxyribonuclease VII large subunit [Lujinxingia sediminis]|uniref:Exodeoxyribonuclease VII large subunit n=1 Tax=Lujinxingia sediminis TaxID=2480984 RepID=A0ABY0CSL8_9DELT|nr:exodeoxyribonuclease VII large subunit [Lujinxingia sediminis]RVU44094.1 exodeoxyribonuclease VII large subunit [Lujinxingia sediminis]